MIEHIVISMLKYAFGSSKPATTRPVGSHYIERTDIVTKETVAQESSRISAGQKAWTVQRKEVSRTLPTPPQKSSVIRDGYTPPTQYKIPLPKK